MGILIALLALLAMGGSRASAAPLPGRANPSREVKAAVTLLEYIRSTGKTTGPVVKEAQRIMGKIDIDGVCGPQTRARAAELGVVLP